MPTLGPALTNVLSDHLRGSPSDRGFWQDLDHWDRIQLSEAIVAAKSGTRSEVRICSYDTQWPYVFARIEQELRAQVGPLVVAIEQVGSTAVPGLAGPKAVRQKVGDAVRDESHERWHKSPRPYLQDIAYCFVCLCVLCDLSLL
jgi:hypothetical protein